MKRTTGIATVESRVLIPVPLLEQHVNSKHHPHEHHDVKAKEEEVISNFENITWCTEELEVDGFIEIHLQAEGNKHRCLIVPVITCLLAVCTKGSDPGYKHTWSCSLS